MAKLTPYIMSQDSRAQAEFYTKALGGEILSVITHEQIPDVSEENKDKVMHLSLVAGGVPIFMTDWIFGTLKLGNNLQLNLEFATDAEARHAYDKLAEGGKATYPLEMQMWGALFGQLEDKYGILWMISGEAKATGS